jgi:filamentous hemagglutinin family protein
VPNISPPAPTAVPQLKGIVQGVSNVVHDQTQNKLTVNQDQSKAIIDWHSFNIGEKAWTRFNQQGNRDWAALNRIYDKNPSQIFGRLTADGKVFLINQNGILFGPNSRINVHTLFASSLNVQDEDFLANLDRFKAEHYNERDDNRVFCFVQDEETGELVPLPGPVANYGSIEASQGGAVFLLAPNVKNEGDIAAPFGQIGLAAGDEVEVLFLSEGSRVFPFVYVEPGKTGIASNAEKGRIMADRGVAGMYGRVVNQQGVIRSVTAIDNKGRIELHASEKVTTGGSSVTTCPISDSPERKHKSFSSGGGAIHVAGLDKVKERLGEFRNEETATEKIEHRGVISGPSGTIDLRAKERVYLEHGSRIDASGAWATTSEPDVVSLQLNSMELKNDYGQKEGALQGEEIQVDPRTGSAIGDVSGALDFEELTAQEMNTKGGEITISAPEGDIIVRQGAEIDFSGGGKVFPHGHYETTKLLSGKEVFDISEAPQWRRYEKILGFQEILHERYGIAETYKGLYCGGSMPLKDYVSAFVEGDDAGSLTLGARRIVLDGTLLGRATRGFFQTDTRISEESYGAFELQTTRGTKEPRGGRLTVGRPPGGSSEDTGEDLLVEELVVSAEKALLPERFGPEDDLSSVLIEGRNPYLSELVYKHREGDAQLLRTILSTETLNGAGLSNLYLYTNTKLTIDEKARLTLYPGGLRLDESIEYQPGMPRQYLDEYPAGFLAAARAVENRGEIRAPSGRIAFSITDTKTSTTNTLANLQKDLVELPNRALLTGGSRLNVAGERLDNLADGRLEPLVFGHIHGGRIFFDDQTNDGAELLVMPEALLDASSGHEIKWDGTLVAGDAGSVWLKSRTMVLNGNARGLSLPGHGGGEIRLHAGSISVKKGRSPAATETMTFDSELREDLRGRLTLYDRQLDESGFTHIALRSFGSVSFESGAALAPSRAKRRPHTTPLIKGIRDYNGMETAGGDTLMDKELVYVRPEFIGPSSFLIEAGASVGVDKDIHTYTVSIPSGASVEVAPGGDIELSALRLNLGGTLSAPGGTVAITTTGTNRDLTLGGTSRILAGGLVIPNGTALARGLAVGRTLLKGGTVTLQAERGDVTVREGALIDISGSQAVQSFVPGPDLSVLPVTVASDAGRVELVGQGAVRLDGDLRVHPALPELKGGFLTISQGLSLNLDPQEIRDLQRKGFDGFAFRCGSTLGFTDSMNLAFRSALLLDAPLIRGIGAQEIRFSAPWLTLANTRAKYGGENDDDLSYRNLIKDDRDLDELAYGEAEAVMSLSGRWVDVKGSVALAGFEEVALRASEDMRVWDEKYINDSDPRTLLWKGQLRTKYDLHLKASRIYPTTLSAFTLKSDQGRITIRASGTEPRGPVLSGGGVLAIEAGEIDHLGYLAAPMGQIALAGKTVIDTRDGLTTITVEEPAERILLGRGSATTTRGQAPVLYGFLEDTKWKVPAKPRTLTPLSDVTAFEDLPDVEDVPTRAIKILAKEALTQESALMDASGGGSLFSYEFLPGIDGLINPLQKSDRHILVPSLSFAGEGVYIPGTEIVPEGTYAFLPEEYAFLEGALVIQELNTQILEGDLSLSQEGWDVIAGYEAVAGTGVRSPLKKMYSVRPASQVLEEGFFNMAEADLGAGGNVTIIGETAYLGGTIKVEPFPWYQPGNVALSAKQIDIGTHDMQLPSGFDFEARLPDPLQGMLYLDPAFFSKTAVEHIHIGKAAGTTGVPAERVTMREGSVLRAPRVTLEASEGVTLEPGAEIHCVDQGVGIEFLSYRYTYDPRIGMGLLSPKEIHAVGEAGDYKGVMNLKSQDGPLPMGFLGRDGRIWWDDAAVKMARDLGTEVLVLPRGTDMAVPIATESGIATLRSPQGILTIDGTAEKEALVHGEDEIRFEMDTLVFKGDIRTDRSALELGGEALYFLPENYRGYIPADGTVITDALWRNFSEIDRITLRSESDVVFLGGLHVVVPEELTLDASRIAAGLLEKDEQGREVANISSDMTIELESRRIALLNSGASSRKESPDSLGEISLEAENIALGHGDMILDGFCEVNLGSLGNSDPAPTRTVMFRGKGSLAVHFEEDMNPAVTQEEGQLRIKADVVTTSYFLDQSTGYEVADFAIDAGFGHVKITGGDNAVQDDLVPGGSLQIMARGVENYGVVDMPYGHLKIEARGSGQETAQEAGIYLHSGSAIRTRGGSQEQTIAWEKVVNFFPGGLVELRSEDGPLVIEKGAIIDVSNLADDLPEGELRDDLYGAGLLDAGTALLYAPNGGVDLRGEVKGSSAIGLGGTFLMDSERIDGFSSLSHKLMEGGFSEQVRLRSRKGNVTIAENDVLKARDVNLSVDEGNLSLYGQIDASGSVRGGSVSLHAGNLLYMYPESRILARGLAADAGGGEVMLGTRDGHIALLSGSLIDASGGEAGGGGTVHFRAPRFEYAPSCDVFVLPFGTVTGASRVVVEAVKCYEDTAISDFDLSVWNSQARTYMSHAATIKDRLLSGMSRIGWNEDQLHLLPGIEVRSAGDLEVASFWDFTPYLSGGFSPAPDLENWWRFPNTKTGEPGVLTLRASGDLIFQENLIDHPNPPLFLTEEYYSKKESWSFNLVAGADLASADVMATQEGWGDIRLGDHLVYTETGRMRFASGGDVKVGDAYPADLMINNQIGYNLASFSGDIQGSVKGDLRIEGGAIQSATGNIEIGTRGDAELMLFSQEQQAVDKGSAIRTTGMAPYQPSLNLVFGAWFYTESRGGGDIWLDVGGDIRLLDIDGSAKTQIPLLSGTSAPRIQYWDNLYYWPNAGGQRWSADYGEYNEYGSTPTAGLATMGGGDVRIKGGGSVSGLIGTFRQGDLSITARGNVGGLVQVAEGRGIINTMGNFESEFENLDASLALFSAQIDVTAQGGIKLGRAYNPTVVDGMPVKYGSLGTPPLAKGSLTYSYGNEGPVSGVRLAALKGNVSLGGVFFPEKGDDENGRALRILPPVFEVTAGGDISLGSQGFVLSPAPEGNLRLIAGGNISGRAEGLSNQKVRPALNVSDLDPSSVYPETGNIVHGDPLSEGGLPLSLLQATHEEDRAHGEVPLHRDDPNPTEIRASGDIEELELYVSKSARLRAGGDVRGLFFFGQNTRSADVTSVRAGGGIFLSSEIEPIRRTGELYGGGDEVVDSGFYFGGPGDFMVQAGDSIDLGITQGIRTVGKSFNEALTVSRPEEEKSSLFLVSGLDKDMDTGDIRDLFGALKQRGEEYSRLQEQGDLSGAGAVIGKAETEVIEPFFEGGVLGSGDLYMTDSRISSEGSSSLVYGESWDGETSQYEESSDIYIVARGDVNVGLTAVPDPQEGGQASETGIFSAQGGGINLFSVGNLDVNESRIMTFRGGDVMAWSHVGDINAGRGSKTAINAEPPELRITYQDEDADGKPDRDERGNPIAKDVTLVFKPPAVGSGIRTLTYDPDGIVGPMEPPALGDAFLFAPKGVIDAGEAGISARNVVLGATEVLRVKNIEVAGFGVGVPRPSQTVNLGALAGAGSLAELSKMTEATSSLASQKGAEAAREAAKMMEEFVPKWVDVKVIGFE